MNKKIKTLVQKYEKDMQFENRFDELKDKLDLIPDQNLNTDIIVIRKKLVPAYTMMIVLLMLVTGIIGLQFGLNSNYISGPERVDLVDEQLLDLFDVFIPESISTYAIDESLLISVYVGIQSGQTRLVIRIISKSPEVSISGTVNSKSIVISSNNFYYFSEVDEDVANLDFSIYKQDSQIGTLTKNIDLSSYFNWLQD